VYEDKDKVEATKHKSTDGKHGDTKRKIKKNGTDNDKNIGDEPGGLLGADGSLSKFRDSILKTYVKVCDALVSTV
jgi:hypothetical protein